MTGRHRDCPPARRCPAAAALLQSHVPAAPAAPAVPAELTAWEQRRTGQRSGRRLAVEGDQGEAGPLLAQVAAAEQPRLTVAAVVEAEAEVAQQRLLSTFAPPGAAAGLEWGVVAAVEPLLLLQLAVAAAAGRPPHVPQAGTCRPCLLPCVLLPSPAAAQQACRPAHPAGAPPLPPGG